MLPFSIKVVWFSLCISGTVCSCFILYVFARCTNHYWGPISYLVGFTVLEGVYCLGMIWHMDPFLMPHSFCLAQITLMNYSTFLLTGVCACFTYATAIAVIFPDSSPHSTLMWRNRYYFPLVIFPIVATSIFMGVVVKYDAAKPSDGTHCDVTDPIWPRLLGYALMPLCLTLPCLVLALVAGYQIVSMHHAHQRVWMASRQLYNGANERNLTELSVRSENRPNIVLKTIDTGSVSTNSPSLVSPSVILKQSHPHDTNPMRPRAFAQTLAVVDPQTSAFPNKYRGPPSPASPTFPTFVGLGHFGAGAECVIPGEIHRKDGPHRTSREGDAVSSMQGRTDDEITRQETRSEIDQEAGYGDAHQSQTSARLCKGIASLSEEQPPGMPASMVSAIWRLILFQSSNYLKHFNAG